MKRKEKTEKEDVLRRRKVSGYGNAKIENGLWVSGMKSVCVKEKGVKGIICTIEKERESRKEVCVREKKSVYVRKCNKERMVRIRDEERVSKKEKGRKE